MRKLFYIGLAMILALLIAVPAMTGINNRFSDIFLGDSGVTRNLIGAPEIGAPSGTPPSNWGWLYVKDSAGTSDIYFEDDAGTVTSLTAAAAGGVANLDEAYDGGGAGAGATIAVDSGPVILTGTHGTTNTLNASASGSGHVFAISNTGTGKDISGTAGWSITKVGLGTFASIGAFTGVGDIDLDDGAGDSPSLTFTDVTNETAVFSKVDDEALTLVTETADGLMITVGNIWVGEAGAGTAAMDGDDVYIEGEIEVDGAAEFDGTVNVDGAFTATSTVGITGAITLANGLTLDNAVNNSFEWNENSEEIKWIFGTTALGLQSTSGVVEFTLFNDLADVILSHSANGAADDFYIKQTGAQDASLIISSTGTGADAMQITTSAGGLDIAVTGAADEDLDITTPTSSINLIASEAIANALVLSAPAGGIDISSAATFDIDITATGGKVLVVATEAAADQFKVDAQGTVAGDAINFKTTDGGIMLNADGGTEGDIELNAAGSIIITAAEAVATGVTILAPAGGIDLTSAATFDIDITATGGRILGVASEAVADQFKIDAQGAVAGDAINLETTSGGIMLNADNATNGDIELNAENDIILTATGLITVSSGVVLPAEVVTSTNVLTVDECGLVSFLNHGTEFDTALPELALVPTGCSFEFFVTAAADTGSYTVTTDSNETLINGIINVDNALTACAAEDTITFVTGDNVGDRAKVISDGTSWIISGEGLGTAKLTCTDV